MKFPRLVDLLHVPTKTLIEAHVVVLTEAAINRGMGITWWNDPAIDADLAELEIDRGWDWAELSIERDGKALPAQKFGVVTGDGAIQGAMMMSTGPVASERTSDVGEPALFVELLFAAPRTRHWVRLDKAEQFRGVGLHLLRTAAQLSIEAGFGGRLKLESSPNFVQWYKKRGLLEVSKSATVYEGVKYAPMELGGDRVSILLPEHRKGV